MGFDYELSKGHVKKGRNGGLTPFDLLQYSVVDAVVNERSVKSLWQEFGIYSKGKRQLEWGRGLKSLKSKTNQIRNWRKKQSMNLFLCVLSMIICLACCVPISFVMNF